MKKLFTRAMVTTMFALATFATVEPQIAIHWP
jgi:hypothetical protein